VLLYPHQIPAQEVIGAVTAFGIGIPVGLGMHWALAPLEQRGWLATLLVRWLSWYVAAESGMIALVRIAGPYVLAGPMRGGGYDDEPITRSELLWMPAVLALGYTLMSMWQDRSKRIRQARGRSDERTVEK
jgi:hypothetical protein